MNRYHVYCSMFLVAVQGCRYLFSPCAVNPGMATLKHLLFYYTKLSKYKMHLLDNCINRILPIPSGHVDEHMNYNICYSQLQKVGKN